ncbi:hypothetical protein [Niastella populi]|uniref:hypothetical protein n=1 Tax=Niastella populi TaxID=550983 RepID=UPI0013FD9A83|nr:hypothetical protein [Niastella populi]
MSLFDGGWHLAGASAIHYQRLAGGARPTPDLTGKKELIFLSLLNYSGDAVSTA